MRLKVRGGGKVLKLIILGFWELLGLGHALILSFSMWALNIIFLIVPKYGFLNKY